MNAMDFVNAIAACCLAMSEPLTQPTHVMDFSDVGDLYSAALSPDGSLLYVLVHGAFVDVGAVVAQYWPEWGAAGAGLLALPLLIVFIRRLRREQRDGEPYCRRCNYNLSARTPDQSRCPECGVELAKRTPVRGRRAWKRAAPWLAALLVVLGAYGALWAFRVPRGAAWLNPGWASASALKLVDRKGLEWLKQYRKQGDVVIEVDASTGERRRTVCGRASSTYFHLVMTPDGSGFYLIRADGNGVDLISTRTGAARATFQPAPPMRLSPAKGAPSRGDFCSEVGGNAIIGHTADGSAILSYWSDSSAVASATVWNPATGEVTHVASTPAYIDNRSGRSYCTGRQFVRVGRVEPVQVISVPLFMEAFPTKSFEVRWFDWAGNQTRTVDLKTTVSPHGLPAVMPDGQLAIFAEQYGKSLISLDLNTGEEAGRVDLDNIGLLSPVLAPDGIRLLVGGMRGMRAIQVRDVQRREWTSSLASPTGFYGPRAITSPTAGRAAAVFQGPQKGPAKWTFCAAIWDIPTARAEGAKP
jgi:hypothetical protein